jgi:hypothetical protein
MKIAAEVHDEFVPGALSKNNAVNITMNPNFS